MDSTVATGHRLHLGDVRTAPISVDFAPQASLVQVLVHSAAPAPGGRLAQSVRRSLGAAGSFSVSCLSDPRVRQVPDVVMPLRPGSHATVDQQVEVLRSTRGEVLTAECFEMWGLQVPAVWRAAVDQPDRWLQSFAAACARGWTTISPYWRRSYPLLRREARRIGLATVTGRADLILGDLHPKIRLEGDELVLKGTCDATTKLGDRRLVLVPMFSPSGAVLASLEDTRSVYICYAVGAAGREPDTNGSDALAVLLGPVRAVIIRSTRSPKTVSQLADLLNCAPSTITYHCDQLVAGGLVVRERRGPATWIRATERAAELEELTTPCHEWA